jgi:hypothetical protein
MIVGCRIFDKLTTVADYLQSISFTIPSTRAGGGVTLGDRRFSCEGVSLRVSLFRVAQTDWKTEGRSGLNEWQSG